MWAQRRFPLEARPRGFHLITGEVRDALPEIRAIEAGMLHLFIQHTSASLSLNENASPDVRRDMETWANATVAEGFPDWTHTLEGSDDMPAHVKAALFGHAIMVPITRGGLALGTWQGIYLGEHRNCGGSRVLVGTVSGEAT